MIEIPKTGFTSLCFTFGKVRFVIRLVKYAGKIYNHFRGTRILISVYDLTTSTRNNVNM